jgi:hypothetical protein
MNKLFILMSLSLVGCATLSSDTTFDIAYHLYDQPANKSIRLEYTNEAHKPICLTPENWPNSGGKINQASDRVWLEVEGSKYPIADFNTGYCIACATKIKPGDKIVGIMPYSEFSLPPNKYEAAKSLIFKPRGFFCT